MIVQFTALFVTTLRTLCGDAQPPTAIEAATAIEVQERAGKEKRPKLSIAEQIDKHIRFARTGSARIRPQAASKLLRLGAPAADRLMAVTKGSDNEELALLGTALIEILGMFEHPELRAKLWPAVDDSEFPWRPAASRSLAYAPLASERARYKAFLDDPIAPVRVSALDALFRLTVDPDPTAPATDEQKASHEEHKLEFLHLAAEQLSDENDVVRRRAAILLDARGHGRALLWLVEDLARTDAFFDRPSGRMARYAAEGLLSDRGINLGKYAAELLPTATEDGKGPNNAAAIKVIASAIKRRAAARAKTFTAKERGIVPSEVSPIARASEPVTGSVIGLELKSCRRGDFFLRWTEDDMLLVGDGNPVRVQLPKGTTAKLVAASRETQFETGDSVLWGRPGCDSEQYRMPRLAPNAETPQLLIVSKGEEKVVDLRPGAIRSLGAAMLATLPDSIASDDARLFELKARVASAFGSIGGPIGGSVVEIPGDKSK